MGNPPESFLTERILKPRFIECDVGVCEYTDPKTG